MDNWFEQLDNFAELVKPTLSIKTPVVNVFWLSTISLTITARHISVSRIVIECALLPDHQDSVQYAGQVALQCVDITLQLKS